MIQKFRNFLTTILIICFIPSFSVAMEGISSTKDIAFIFYKLIDKKPDYDLWVKYLSNERYTYGELGERDYLLEVRENLHKDFAATDVQNEMIVIKQEARMEILPVDKNNPTKYFINIYFRDQPLFFGVQIPDYKINIVAEGVEDAVKFMISDNEYERIRDRFYAKKIYKENVVQLKLFFKPIKADGEYPIIKDGKEFYMMLAKLEKFEIYNDIGTNIYWPLPMTEEQVKAKQEMEQKADFLNKYK